MLLKSYKINLLIMSCFCITSLAQVAEKEHQYKLSEWQKAPLSFYQVNNQRFLIEGAGIFAAGNIKNSAAQETDKIENFGGELASEYGFSDMMAARVQMGYLSGKQKNATTSTKIDGLKDIAALFKLRITMPMYVLVEAGIETSPEALKVDNVARTLTASSGGTKAVVKGGVQFPHAKYTFGGWVYYKHFLQREMELISNLGSENLKIDGGHQFGAGGFFEFGTGLRTGLELKWSLQNSSTVKSVNVPTMSNFELEHQKVLAGGYLKIPAGENLLLYIKGDYDFNPNKKRGDQSYDQDELFQAYVGAQALF